MQLFSMFFRLREFFLILLFCFPVALYAEEAALPFSQNDQLADGWTVVSIERQTEFVRYRLSKGSETTGIEVASNSDGSGEWATEHYRLMPAPGQSPPENLLLAAMEVLRRFDAGGTDPPVVKTIIKDPPEGWEARSLRYRNLAVTAALVLLAIVSLVLIFLWWRKTDRQKKVTQLKHLQHRLIVLSPVWVLIVLIVAAGIRINEINAINGEDMVSMIRAKLDKNMQNSKPFVFKEEYGQTGYEIEDQGAIHFIPLSQNPEDVMIYVYGASSVVSPGYGQAFARQLEYLLQNQVGSQLTVHNFGRPGMDSFQIAEKMKDTINQKPPALAIVYCGHRDYASAYQQVKSAYSLFNRTTILKTTARILHLLVIKPVAEMVGSRQLAEWDAFMETVLQPQSLRVLRDLGWIAIDPALFTFLDREVPARFAQNISRMVAVAREHDVQLLFLTPISNLYVPPIGVERKPREMFDAARDEPEYRKRVATLNAAKDGDRFGGTIRAKSDLLSILRGLEGDGVSVLDLQNELQAAGFPFDSSAFSDAVHFKSDLHRRVARLILQHIESKTLLPDGPSTEEHPQNNLDRKTP